MRTAVVILNWNTRSFLERFLPGLSSSFKGDTQAEVIVADNASDDGSVEFMKAAFPDVRTIVFNRNLGFTGGYNKAFEEIFTKGGDDAPEYFLLMNSDIEVEEGWLEPLVRWMDSHPDCGACAPKLRSWHDRKMFEYAGAAGGCIDSFGYPFCRGRIMGMDQLHDKHGWSVVEAEVPEAEMSDYVHALRAISQGRANFTFYFDHYEEAPANVAEKIIAAAKE